MFSRLSLTEGDGGVIEWEEADRFSNAKAEFLTATIMSYTRGWLEETNCSAVTVKNSSQLTIT